MKNSGRSELTGLTLKPDPNFNTSPNPITDTVILLLFTLTGYRYL